MKRTFIIIILICLMTPLFSESRLSQYFGKTFHGNMMGKIITADMKIIDDEKIEFSVNTPSGKKKHIYSYRLKEKGESCLITEWYEDGKLDKIVTISDFTDISFVLELKGKGKIKMKKKQN